MKIDQNAPRLSNKPLEFVLSFAKLFWAYILIMFIMEVGQATCSILMPYTLKTVIEMVEQNGLNKNLFKILIPALMTFIYLNIGELFFSRMSGGILVTIAPRLRKKVRESLYHYLQYHSQKFFLSNFSGSIANRISEVSQGVNHSIWTVMFDFLPLLITFSVSSYLLSKAYIGLSILLIVWISIYIIVSFVLAKKCRFYAKEFAASRSLVSGKIVDSVTNVLNTKTFSENAFERKYLNSFLDLEVGQASKTLWFMEKMKWFQFSFCLLLKVAIIFYSVFLLSKNQIRIGDFAMTLTLSLLIINDARNLSRRFLEFFEYIGNITDGVSMIVKNHDVIDLQNAKPVLISRGEILFKNVTFSYTQNKNIFENFNAHIKSGSKVGLVGFSGSGKTTFVNLILRFYDIQSGEIIIDNQNINEVTQDSLRSQIGLIPQDPMLFHRTLFENIKYGKMNSTSDEVIKASKLANAHEFIQNLEGNYESLVGERGVKLSGGQRQRIAIARAILKNAPILIMDEATSSLDSITEKSIQISLNEIMKGKTVIIVAHRLSTISKLDRIIVFDKGKIIEDGSHLELLNLRGHYSKLWSMQSGGFLPDMPQETQSLYN